MTVAQSENWYLLRSGPGAGAWNMGLDEALLEAVARWGQPVLRFYGWTEPAATFGYFQKYADVERLTPLRPLIRRPTGGGLVSHTADWTYCLAVPPGHGWYALRATESYARLHNWLRLAFAAMGAVTSLAPGPRKEAPGQCFVGAEQSDLLWQDRKIAGAAQRRNRQGLLVQGSVQPPSGWARADWEGSLGAVAAREWGVNWTPFSVNPRLGDRAAALAEEKYSELAYNQRR